MTERLLREPYRFSFFQAVRILERVGSWPGSARAARSAVGWDHGPEQEVVRFHAMPTHTFPASDVHSVSSATPRAGGSSSPPDMVVAFLGMTGPQGVLPQHYTQLVIDRIRHRDFALRDFLDVFNHRSISFFYRAWRKYRFYVGYERSRSEAGAEDEDLFTQCLFCLVGLGTGRLRGRQDILDETLLYYAGFFADRSRPAVTLEAVIGDYFQLPASVVQFCGQWLYLDVEDQSRPGSEAAWNNQLGTNVVIGERVWSVENKFRVRLGPLSYRQFRRFSPLGDLLKPHCQLARTFVGPEFDFDVQPVLRAEEVPLCRLGGDGRDPSYLGWNSWLRSLPFPRDAEDAVFVEEGWPAR